MNMLAFCLIKLLIVSIYNYCYIFVRLYFDHYWRHIGYLFLHNIIITIIFSEKDNFCKNNLYFKHLEFINFFMYEQKNSRFIWQIIKERILTSQDRNVI